MLKAVSLTVMVAAMGLAGIMKAEELKCRIQLLEDLVTMLLRLKSQMKYFREPLEILLARLAETADSRAFRLLGACVPVLAANDGEIGGIWAENTIRIYEKTPLTDEDRDIVLQIGTYLGQTDFEGQQIQFSCTEERLHQQIVQARENFSRKAPMYRKIGFLGGAAAALIVL